MYSYPTMLIEKIMPVKLRFVSSLIYQKISNDTLFFEKLLLSIESRIVLYIWGVGLKHALYRLPSLIRYRQIFSGGVSDQNENLVGRKWRIGRKIFGAPPARKNFPTNFSFSSDQIFILVRYPPWKNLAITYDSVIH